MTSIPASTKIALITGANKGIGFAIAKQLATEHKGYHILMGSRDPERGREAAAALQKEGLSVEALEIDVSDDNSIAAAAQSVATKFGRLDVLINNAGIWLDPRNAASDRAVYEKTFAVNVFGAAATTEAFVPLLEKSAAARLVFVSSDLGSLTFRANPEGRHNFVNGPAYRCSKAAMNMLALGYAHQFLGKPGWKVNIHNPGYTATDLNGNMGAGTVEDGAKNAVRLATLGEDGETATYSEREGPLPW